MKKSSAMPKNSAQKTSAKPAAQTRKSAPKKKVTEFVTRADFFADAPTRKTTRATKNSRPNSRPTQKERAAAKAGENFEQNSSENIKKNPRARSQNASDARNAIDRSESRNAKGRSAPYHPRARKKEFANNEEFDAQTAPLRGRRNARSEFAADKNNGAPRRENPARNAANRGQNRLEETKTKVPKSRVRSENRGEKQSEHTREFNETSRAENYDEKAIKKRAPRHEIAEAKPERLHKLLAQSGLGARREMETLISEGKVQVNGEIATLGQSATIGDRIKVNGKMVNLRFSVALPRILLYHKPEGEIVSRNDPNHRPSVFNSLPPLKNGRWVAIGRLDFNTSGLLIFTSSGDLANRLMHPRYELVREYAVRILGELTDEIKKALLEGIELEDGLAQFSTLIEAGGTGANQWYRVTLSEGRNREVRRMFEAVGLTVSRLMRVRYGPFVLPSFIKRGKTLELLPEEVKNYLKFFELGELIPESAKKEIVEKRKSVAKARRY